MNVCMCICVYVYVCICVFVWLVTSALVERTPILIDLLGCFCGRATDRVCIYPGICYYVCIQPEPAVLFLWSTCFLRLLILIKLQLHNKSWEQGSIVSLNFIPSYLESFHVLWVQVTSPEMRVDVSQSFPFEMMTCLWFNWCFLSQHSM